jgi:GntR family transcriptional regulator
MSSSESNANFPLTLDTDCYVPYYEQIVQQVKELLKTERLKEGQVFFSERDVAERLGISKMPVRQAYQKLRSEGLLIVEKGKRPVISTGQVSWNFQQLRGFSEEMLRRGLKPSAKLLHCEIVAPSQEVSHALKLREHEKVFEIKRLRLVNGDPVALVDSYVAERQFPNMSRHNLENRSLYEIYESVYHRQLYWAKEKIGAVAATEQEAGVLDTTAGSPLLLIRETNYDNAYMPIEYSRSLLRGDRYTASLISVRKQASVAHRR